MRAGLFLALLACLSGCGAEPASEDYRFASVADIDLTPQKHPHGYGKGDCFYCHVKANIHQENRVASPLVELARVLVERSGLDSCRGCHGSNGVGQ